MQQKHPDAKLIEALGGPTRIAELICVEKMGGVQRIQNWTVRGIPAAMKVKYPHLFMPHDGIVRTAEGQGA